jgi:hypothetical protein
VTCETFLQWYSGKLRGKEKKSLYFLSELAFGGGPKEALLFKILKIERALVFLWLVDLCLLRYLLATSSTAMTMTGRFTLSYVFQNGAFHGPPDFFLLSICFFGFIFVHILPLVFLHPNSVSAHTSYKNFFIPIQLADFSPVEDDLIICVLRFCSLCQYGKTK